MLENGSRRPLKVRDHNYSVKIAKFLSTKNITPNQISVASIFFSLLSGICILLINTQSNFELWFYSILAALFIQMRLLCNLFDGMVAMEGGKSTKSGELYNDIPDRISDSIIFICIGYSLSLVTWGAQLGFFAALIAMMTAYVRVLGSSMGAGSCFKGPMAKQHRMAITTFALVLTPIEFIILEENYLLFLTLIIIGIGTVITVCNRVLNIYNTLERP